MRIALINENSQAAKNSIIEASLRKVVRPGQARDLQVHGIDPSRAGSGPRKGCFCWKEVQRVFLR